MLLIFKSIFALLLNFPNFFCFYLFSFTFKNYYFLNDDYNYLFNIDFKSFYASNYKNIPRIYTCTNAFFKIKKVT